MDNLCDEILQLIFFELHDPTPFTLLSKRLYKFSQDPYARAHYFLNRYGPSQAVFEALGRGKVVNERVLDILISSGAHLSRYLVQIAMHHYFHTQTHFIKSRWCRDVPLPVFIHFLQLGSARYGDIPREKGRDDGSLFSSFVRERSFPPSMRHTTWEQVRDILENFNFIPFSPKDPVMAQFPLALAIEPRLLPYAVANGFCMDEKYRDFVFRKMFENSPSSNDRTADLIAANVRELCRLDPSMFLSRTVGAEICMEAKHNEAGYGALKLLAKSGDLRFDLPALTQDLIKLFLKTRSITSANTQANLRHLYADFPSSDPSIRLVMLLTAILPSDNVTSFKAKLEPLKLEPITEEDMLNLFLHPFMERQSVVFDFMKQELQSSDESSRKGLNQGEVKSVVEKLATRLLEADSKGKLLRWLHDRYITVPETIIQAVIEKHDVKLDDLPDPTDSEACKSYNASLCTDQFYSKPPDSVYFWTPLPAADEPLGDEHAEHAEDDVSTESTSSADSSDLGVIGPNSLTTMLNHEELMPARSRRRSYLPYLLNQDHFTYYPTDYLLVAKWIKGEFGAKSSITAVFMKHAVLNDNISVLRHYLHDTTSRVPITLKHFEFLAHIGRAANYTIFTAIQEGAEFFRSEDDYIDNKRDSSVRIYNRMKNKKKGSFSHPQVSVVFERPSSSSSTSSSSVIGQKRPRRNAATTTRSYVVPDSDDEEKDAMIVDKPEEKVKQVKIDHLQLWVKHLSDLQKSEQAKFRQRKKRAGDDSNEGVEKSEFLKSLSSNLRSLRKYADEKRKTSEALYPAPESDDDEYIYKSPRSKRRKVQHD